jgi:glycosyltransferase involved in cell wall biosynthesis
VRVNIVLKVAEFPLIDTAPVPETRSEPELAPRVALIGGFTPRRCGIATFTADIHAALSLAAPDVEIDVYALRPALDDTRFDDPVCGVIVAEDPDSYVAAAHRITKSGADILWLQHEFGLFGGPAGDLILELVERVAAPLVVTLHTVLAEPDLAQREVMRRLVTRAFRLIVMSERSRDLLRSVYHADEDQIVVIPHGVPDRPFGRSARFKEKFGLAGRQILLTFGLLSQGKGIENVIRALPAIVADHPDLLYCIVGATHPNQVAREGEAYRNGLKALANSLSVADHIHWIDCFVETGELLDLIEMADIYVTPYPGAGQSTSGTLSYAVALGKAVISTPYIHAVELLGEDHGVLVPFNDSKAIAREVGALLDDPDRLTALQKRAYNRGRAMIWSEFAARSLDVISATRVKSALGRTFKTVGIEGLLRICDDTGILQHSVHSVPDRAHGYCVDDNARGLMLMNRLGGETEPHRRQLAHVFAAFVQSAWNENTGNFRNFMDFRRNWLEDTGSQDSCGRTLWALGATAHEGRAPGLRRWARGLFETAAPSAEAFGSPRAAAFAMLGADFLLRSDPGHELAMRILGHGADRLLSLYRQVRRTDWPWFETRLAYDNCRLPEAMIRAGIRLANDDFAQCGLASLHWIMDRQVSASSRFRPVGSGNFGHDFETSAPFDQQPVEIWAAIDACKSAFDATGDVAWFGRARLAHEWFFGNNDRGVAVGEPVTGTCHDGINPRGINRNEGAESVLAFQLATCAMRDFQNKVGSFLA